MLAVAVLAACTGTRAPRVESTVEVLDPGAEPRTLLRHEFRVGQREAFEITSRVRTKDRFENTVLEHGERMFDWPSVTTHGHLEVTAVTPEFAEVSIAIDNLTVHEDVIDPKLVPPLKARAAKLAGATGTLRITPTGKVDVRLADPLKDELGGMHDLFPSVPVGVDAEWQTVARVTINGERWDRTTRYRLARQDGRTVDLEFTVTLRATEQTVTVEPNRSLRLVSGSGTTKGTMQLRLDSLVPSTSFEQQTDTSYLVVNRKLRVSSTRHSEYVYSSRPCPASGC